MPALSSLRWNNLRSHVEVLGAASSQLKLLCGALSRLVGSVHIELGTVYDFKPDGRYEVNRVTEIELEVRPGTEATPQEFRRLLVAADAHDWLGSLLMLSAETQDWYTIYKMIEAIEGHCGGLERQMLNCTYLEGLELKRAKRTANSVRHIDQAHHQPPKTPMSLSDARALVRRSIDEILKQTVARQ